jgi:hypothetical protein
MQKNNAAKYLKYAVGEVLLVVVGILNALAINWQNNTFKRILGSLEKCKKEALHTQLLIKATKYSTAME